eukprot:CAMPEP_0181306236 /NCGR_PEP_ID=MMETSP1101-20121128/10185_1 /TAXON_ID=46948 /ORGANISM="Rhodomonas abbreviata, Strain Caron Lab Isolate" /LENGTH=911 /DNA_ID=CAMNT_0023412265 /DNA_START=450 /DNA_END=3181 /DNA_ORIENTATION=+
MLDVYLSADHKFPMQWYTIVDLESDEPAIATGYLRLSVIINSMDESGAALDDVPEEERARCELLEIPRQHAYLTATGRYNLIFKIFKGCDLKCQDSTWNTSDTYVHVSTPTGENRTDTRFSDLNPTYNQQLQIPLFEPMFRHLIVVGLWSQGISSDTLVATIPMSWKDIFCDQEHYKEAHWYDLFALPSPSTFDSGLEVAESAINYVRGGISKIGWIDSQYMDLKAGVNQSVNAAYGLFSSTAADTAGSFEEASVYCGRLLFSVEVENREGQGKLPSLAQTDMKPKDCKLFEDTKQTMFFRFQVFCGQGLKVSSLGGCQAEVEVKIGNKTCTSKRVGKSKDGLFNWYQALEVEHAVPFDDEKWQWTEGDYNDGYFPAALIDHSLPPVWIRVYRKEPMMPRQLVAFKKCNLRELLQLEDNGGSGGAHGSQLKTGNNVNATVILNVLKGSHPPFFIPAADSVNEHFLQKNHASWTKDNPPWPRDNDMRGNTVAMDPYLGLTCLELEKDRSCADEPHDTAGFLWLSAKLYLPSRNQCNAAKKGPPILSPFTKYNELPIPRPDQMVLCQAKFTLRLHVFQAKDIPTVNPIGLASAYVEVVFYNHRAKTHVVVWSNSPTWDKTLTIPKVSIPCLAWPGSTRDDDDDDDKDWETYELWANGPEEWQRNYEMLRFAQRIEVRVMEGKTRARLLGRCFVKPEDCLHTQVDPTWRELYLSNPEQDEGKILFSAQIIHELDPVAKLPPTDLVPQRLDGDHAAAYMASKKKKTGDEGFNWDTSSAEFRVGDEKYFAQAFDRSKMPPEQEARNAAAVFMRECKIQVQVLGLRNMCPSLGLVNPSLHIFVQTTERWDGDSMCCRSTKPKNCRDEKGNKLNDPTFMEQLELLLLLPDDEEYAPDLEFIVFDDVGGWAQAWRGRWA